MIDLNNTPRLTIDRLHYDGCYKLLETFLKYIADDYCAALRGYLKNKNDKNNREYYISSREFFLSKYFSDLTGLCGEDILSRLDAGVKDGRY